MNTGMDRVGGREGEVNREDEWRQGGRERGRGGIMQAQKERPQKGGSDIEKCGGREGGKGRWKRKKGRKKGKQRRRGERVMEREGRKGKRE